MSVKLHVPVILSFRRQRQDDHEFEASLGFLASSRLARAT